MTNHYNNRNNGAVAWFSSANWTMHYRDSFESLCGAHAVSSEYQESALKLVGGSLTVAMDAEQENEEPVVLPTLRVSAKAHLCESTAAPFATDPNAIHAVLAKIAGLGWRSI